MHQSDSDPKNVKDPKGRPVSGAGPRVGGYVNIHGKAGEKKKTEHDHDKKDEEKHEEKKVSNHEKVNSAHGVRSPVVAKGKQPEPKKYGSPSAHVSGGAKKSGKVPVPDPKKKATEAKGEEKKNEVKMEGEAKPDTIKEQPKEEVTEAVKEIEDNDEPIEQREAVKKNEMVEAPQVEEKPHVPEEEERQFEQQEGGHVDEFKPTQKYGDDDEILEFKPKAEASHPDQEENHTSPEEEKPV